MPDATQPTPIRLTRARALALLSAANRGVQEWEWEVKDVLDTDDIEVMRSAQAQDVERAHALEAMEIVKKRYAGGEGPADPKFTLF